MISTTKNNKFTEEMQRNVSLFLDEIIHSSKDDFLQNLMSMIRKQNIAITLEEMPKNNLGSSGRDSIQISQKAINGISEVDLSYILLHQYFHIVEGAILPLSISPTRKFELADHFAQVVISTVYKTHSKYTFDTKSLSKNIKSNI